MFKIIGNRFGSPQFQIGELVQTKRIGYLGYILGLGILYEKPECTWHYELSLINSTGSQTLTTNIFFEEELGKIFPAKTLPIQIDEPAFKVGDIIKETDKTLRLVINITLNLEVNMEEVFTQNKRLKLPYSYNYVLKKWNDKEKRINDDDTILLM